MCLCVEGEKVKGLISKQLQHFDRGVCQIFICVREARRPSGGVGQTDSTHSCSYDPGGMAGREGKREKLGNKVVQSMPRLYGANNKG